MLQTKDYLSLEDRLDTLKIIIDELLYEEQDFESMITEIILGIEKEAREYVAANPIDHTAAWALRGSALQLTVLAKIYSPVKFLWIFARDFNSITKNIKRKIANGREELYSPRDSSNASDYHSGGKMSDDVLFCKKITYWDQYILYLIEVEELSVREIETLTGYAKSSVHDNIAHINNIYRSYNES